MSNTKNKMDFYSFFYILIAVFSFLYALHITIYYANQVPLDLYSFRQTQTALTAYWLAQNGFSFSYETPVAGLPWSIPFEFPIYQYIVALISKTTSFSLNAIGRVVSFIFLTLCIVPVRSITKNLNLPQSVFFVFTALLFSSPLYLYWGRTFMIETTTVFFSIMAIKYFVDIVQKQRSYNNTFLFCLFMTLSILQKATTGLPVLLILALSYVFLTVRGNNSLKFMHFGKNTIFVLLLFGLPLTVGVLWTLYTDHIKTLNLLGSQLTSTSLSTWNWGTLSQRLSFDLYKEVIGKRIFEQNLGGLLGIALLLITFFSNIRNEIKFPFFICLLLGFSPLFLFTNLHIIHSYYQSANVIFLLYAIAITFGYVLDLYFERKLISFSILALLIFSNYIHFYGKYLIVIKTTYNKANSQDYAVSETLRRAVPKGKYFITFGNNWSSSFSYLSERKSFTVPLFFKQYREISTNPENFIEESRLGAVILCLPLTSPTLNTLIEWSSNARNWTIQKVHNCYIATPEEQFADNKAEISHRDCDGNIELIKVEEFENHKNLSVSGWVALSGKNGIVPEKVYVMLEKKNNKPLYFKANQFRRPDVNKHFGQPNLGNCGFSVQIITDSLKGDYKLRIVVFNKGSPELCQLEKEVLIKE